MYKDVGMASQKVCKQGRDDIIVKVNVQSLIPTSFTLLTSVKMIAYFLECHPYIFNVF